MFSVILKIMSLVQPVNHISVHHATLHPVQYAPVHHTPVHHTPVHHTPVHHTPGHQTLNFPQTKIHLQPTHHVQTQVHTNIHPQQSHVQPTHTHIHSVTQPNHPATHVTHPQHSTHHPTVIQHQSHNGITVRDASHSVNGVRYDPVSGTGCYGPIHKHDTNTNVYDRPDSKLSDVLKFQHEHKMLHPTPVNDVFVVKTSTTHDGKINIASHNNQTLMARSMDLSKPTKECGGWSITIPPVGSISQTKCDDGSKSITSCIGVPGVFQDCGTLSTASNGSQTYTDSTKIGPFSWSSTFDMK